MSKGFDMLRDYIENDALCMRRRKCCDFEYELQQEFAALETENASLRGAVKGLGELCDRYKAENAKLRELVEAMASRLRWADEVTGGGVLDARLKRQLRELGIEVNG